MVESLINRKCSANKRDGRERYLNDQTLDLFIGGISKRDNGAIMIQVENDPEESSAARMFCIRSIQR